MTSPVEIVRRFYDALGRADVPGVLATLNDNVEWTEAERFPYYTGTWHGPQAVLDNLLVCVANDWNGFAATPFDFIVDGNRVVALGTYTGTYKKTGCEISVPYAHIWTVNGETLTKFVQHTDTAKLLEATNAGPLLPE
jgi:ketosteroid isomerase-like protein